jgi:hypothetical protein
MMNAGGGALPWGVVDKPYTPGQTYPIYTDNSGSNNGSISLPAVTNNGSCSASGANVYHDEIVGGIVTTCPVKVGDVLNVKGGQNAGPTQSAVSSRCPTLEPASSVVTFPGAGSPNIIEPGSCQLVLLPTVLDDSTNTPVWPTSGHGDVRVTGFSWWVITAVGQQGKEVDAVYVGSAGSGTLPGAYVAQLTG